MSPRKTSSSWRRWPLRFRLRTALVLMLAAAVSLGVWRAYFFGFLQEQAAAETLRKAGATIETRTVDALWLRIALDEKALSAPAHVNLEDVEFHDDLLPHLLALSHLESLIVSGAGFTADHLQKLQGLQRLRCLIVDSTSVSDDERLALSAERPDLNIHRSQARAIAQFRAGGGSVNGSPFAAATVAQGRAAARAKTTTANSHFVGANSLQARFGKRHFEIATSAKMNKPSGASSSSSRLAALRHLTTLQELDLSSARGTDQFLAELAGRLPQLEHLNLSDTDISDAGMCYVAEFSELQELLLFHTTVGDAGVAPLAELTQLEKLDLRQTNVTDACLAHLLVLSQLRSLELAHTGITDRGGESLQRMAALRWLNLSNTKVTLQGSHDLQERLPLAPIVIMH